MAAKTYDVIVIGAGSVGVPAAWSIARSGLKVIVLDDVITTGATMRECARALKKAGASEVTALSIARTY